MIKGKTKSGFKYEFNPDMLKDWDYLETVEDIENGNGTMSNIKKLLSMLIGDEGFNNLKEHLRKKNKGCADVDLIKEEFAEICANPEVKNYLTSHT